MEITYTQYIGNIIKIEASLPKNPNLYPDKGKLAEKHPDEVAAIIQSREADASSPDPLLSAKLS